MGQTRKLFRFEKASGVTMIGAIVLALVIANSPLAPIYNVIHHTPVHIRFGPLIIDEPLVNWINDGLMVIFFLLIGLEIKRQFLEGHLSSMKCAMLPAFAALGGMIVPAVIYAGLNWDDSVALRGWAIPTATDIVLVLGILSLLGPKIPVSLRIFLTALAIFDDIGAVLIISLFYGAALKSVPLFIAALAVLGLGLMNRLSVAYPAAYGTLGLVLWTAMLKSGLDAALAGFLIAMAIPLRIPGQGASSPLRDIERRLHAWNVLLVVPLFAFFNAGIAVDAPIDNLLNGSISWGVIAGLFVGKQVGVFFASRAAVALGLGQLPDGMNWMQLYGAAILAGVGFTMSMFVATLAFSDLAIASSSKLAVLIGSSLSAGVGILVLSLAVGSRLPN